MNIPQLTALCLRYHGVLLDASEEVVHVAVVDAPSHELLDALHFATTKRIEITCWTRQQMEGHASRTQQTLPVAVQEKHQPKAELLTRTLHLRWNNARLIHIEPATMPTASALRIDGVLHPPDVSPMPESHNRQIKSAGKPGYCGTSRRTAIMSNWQETPSHFVLRPTIGGEKVVARLLQQGLALDVNTLGMQPLQRRTLLCLATTQGLVLVAGANGAARS